MVLAPLCLPPTPPRMGGWCKLGVVVVVGVVGVMSEVITAMDMDMGMDMGMGTAMLAQGAPARVDKACRDN